MKFSLNVCKFKLFNSKLCKFKHCKFKLCTSHFVISNFVTQPKEMRSTLHNFNSTVQVYIVNLRLLNLFWYFVRFCFRFRRYYRYIMSLAFLSNKCHQKQYVNRWKTGAICINKSSITVSPMSPLIYPIEVLICCMLPN